MPARSVGTTTGTEHGLKPHALRLLWRLAPAAAVAVAPVPPHGLAHPRQLPRAALRPKPLVLPALPPLGVPAAPRQRVGLHSTELLLLCLHLVLRIGLLLQVEVIDALFLIQRHKSTSAVLL